MEATALSLAQTVVGGVLKKASSVAVDEVAKILGVRRDIWYIRDELEMMQAFLVAAEARQDKNNVMLIWFRQVKRLAYQIEDCLAEFFLHLENRSLCYRLQTLSTRRQIASKIRDIRVKVEETSKRNLRYNLIDPLKSNSDATSSNDNFAARMDAFVVEETELVDQIESKNKLLNLITESNKNRKVIWVTGMGGLGKTTLVKKVFDSSVLSNKFSYRMWFTVSHTFILKDLLTKILLDKEGEFRNENEDKLIERVRSKLEQNAYLVVLDDLWTNQAWDIIEKVFPNNEEGSRVMVTTRNADVAKYCNWKFKDSYAVQFLSDERSRELLLRKIYKSNEVPDSHKDLNLDLVTEKIIKKCGGLPLAIVTIGGLLASKPRNKEEWEKLLDRLGSELETNPTAEATKQILELSYHDLPYWLKPCLLYLSIFPEDFEIKCNRLVYLWMAEGFVREKRGMTPEEVAEEYLSELINRNLIQPLRIRLDGTIKSCRVHDIMRELLVAKSIEENLVFITGEQKNITLVDNIRHLVITSSNDMRRTNLKSVRSVSVFGPHLPSYLSSPSYPKLLRVLDLRSVMGGLDDSPLSFENFIKAARGSSDIVLSYENFKKASRHLGQFEHLRYISMPPSYAGEIPKSLGNLRGLQTLDARLFDVRRWSTNITKLQHLRRLFTSRGYPVAISKGLGNLKELQVLKWVDLKRSHRRVVEELGQLRQLRKLGVLNLRREHYEKFLASIGELNSLRSLGIGIAESAKAAAGCLDNVSLPVDLRSITLVGSIETLPVWISSLYNLTKVTLSYTKLDDAAIVVLQELPNLLLLKLQRGSYVGTRLTFRSAKFSKLKELFVWELKNLEKLVFEEGTLPELQTLKIRDCELKSGIIGAEHLPKLKKLIFDIHVYVANLDEVQKRVGEHPNRPALEIEDPEYQKLKTLTVLHLNRGNTSGVNHQQTKTQRR